MEIKVYYFYMLIVNYKLVKIYKVDIDEYKYIFLDLDNKLKIDIIFILIYYIILYGVISFFYLNRNRNRKLLYINYKVWKRSEIFLIIIDKKELIYDCVCEK